MDKMNLLENVTTEISKLESWSILSKNAEIWYVLPVSLGGILTFLGSAIQNEKEIDFTFFAIFFGVSIGIYLNGKIESTRKIEPVLSRLKRIKIELSNYK